MAVCRWTALHPEKRRKTWCLDHEEGTAGRGGSRNCHRCVASHLQHPFGSGMSGQAGETDPARFQMNEEQHVVSGKTSPGEYFNGEEVGTGQDGHVGGDEILP